VQPAAQHLLVIEKEAVFRMLCDAKIWEQYPVILATGQGMPDVATRAMLLHITTSLAQNAEAAPAASMPTNGCGRMTALGLVDWNPSGCYILCNYKFGNKKGSRQSAEYGLLALLV
jgi:meiotic recombination protein SPO11